MSRRVCGLEILERQRVHRLCEILDWRNEWEHGVVGAEV